MKSKNPLIVLAISTGFSLTAVGDVITPLLSTDSGSVTSSFLTSEDAVRTIDAALNGSGLSAPPTDANVLTVEHTAATATDNHYLGNTSLTGGGAIIADEVLTFDLGGVFDVTDIYLWTYERSQASRGLVSFDIAFSTDGGTTFGTPVAASTLGITDFQLWGVWTVRTPQKRTFSATQTGVNAIQFSNIVNGGDTGRLGISEIRFGGVPVGTPAGPVDPGASTVDASPTAVLADGTSTSTITVTLKDIVGTPVTGEDVTLTAAPGTPTLSISPSGTQTSDGTGVATFTVSSSTAGTEVFTATSSTDSVTVTQTASVDFQSTAVDAGNSTVSASPAAVPANGIATSTITVTLKNSGGLLLPGKLVSLAGDGENDVAPAGAGTDTTDANGEAIFTVESGATGTEVFTATSESVTVTQTASVDFTEVPPGVVITPVDASSVSFNSDGRVITATIDGSGLSDVSDPSTELDDVHPYIAAGGNYWLSSVTAPNEEITFDLGGSYDVNGVYYWMYTRDNRRNPQTFDISYSTDGGTTFSTPVTAASLNMADWSQSLGTREDSFAELRTIDTLPAITHIRFTNIQASGGAAQLLGLHEIRFNGVPVGTGSAYATWSGGVPADGDANGDGVSNAVAYALGASDVNENAIGRLPTFDNSDPDDFVFTFNRSDAAEEDATTTITVEYSTTLTGWKTAPNVADQVTVDDSGASVGGLTPVIVTIPKALAADGKLFARLKVVVSP